MAIIINDISFSVDKTKIKQELMINSSRDEKSFAAMVDRAKKIAHPRAIYKDTIIEQKTKKQVQIEGIKFESKILRKNLDSTNRIIAYVMTVGNEIADWAKGKQDILESYWADEIQKEILNSAVNKIYNKFDRLLSTQDKYVSVMNPGSLADWSIQEQKKLFAVLGDVENKIGVQLTDSYLMLPSKSVSGIKFTTETEFENCELCQRENCPNRRALFKQKKLEKMNLS